MGRPADKPALLETAANRFEALWKLISALPEEEQNAVFMLEGSEKRKEAH